MDATEKEIKKIEKEIKGIYSEAKKDINKKISDFTAKFKAEDTVHRQELKDGVISKADYKDWKAGQVFQGNQWKSKKQQIVNTLANANSEALKIVNGGKLSCFMHGANETAYQLEHTAGVNFGFNIYNTQAVTNIIKDNPSLLPPKKLNVAKDTAWNMKKVNSQVAQSIIQGESVDALASRLSGITGSQNEAQMIRTARTSLTSARNGGTQHRLEEALKKGIKCHKEWMSVLDLKTRDAHRELDGQIVDVKKPFHIWGYEIDYPGDPKAEAFLVYNCRCTMNGELDDYPSEDYERYDNIDGKPIKAMTYNEWAKAKGIPLNQPKLTQTQQLQTKMQDINQQLSNILGGIPEDKVYHNIWKNDVTLEDWEDKKDSIQAKMDYFDDQIAKAKAIGDTATVNKFENLKAELKEFDKYGSQASQYYKDLHEVEKELKKAKLADIASGNQFGADAYTQARKDAAIWAKTKKEADDALRPVAGEVWRDATKAEKEAIYEYTQSFHKFNEPLRGWEYGSNVYKGVGNTDLNAGYANNGKMLNDMTSIIDKSTYTEDFWFQRGCRFDGMDKFLQVDSSLLRNGTQEQLENALLGTNVTEYGFMSMGSAKGQGFNGDILMNIYAPSGTKMMYVEPISAFGHGDKLSWDGVSGQNYFGSELETIMQQGTQFTITKVERASRYDTIYLDLEVSNQLPPQLWEGK